MTPPDAGAGLYAPLRPRLARVVSAVLAVLLAAGAVLLLLALPVPRSWGDGADRAGILLLAAGLVWFLARQASVRALVDEEGVTVHNLVRARRLAWAEVVSVRFGHGRPWAQLDLADGGTLAVMAVQEADGRFGQREARRLATLVALHEGREGDDGRRGGL